MNPCVADLKNSKLRLKLKQWELEFVEETGRKPLKDDIAEASSEIRDAYKSYWKAKSVESSVCRMPKRKEDASKVESNPSCKVPSIWGLSLNKRSDNGASKNSKKPPSHALAKYTEKLQANAILLRNKSPTAKQKVESITGGDKQLPSIDQSSSHSVELTPSEKDKKEKNSSSRFFGSVKVNITTAESQLAKSSKPITVGPRSILNRDMQAYSSFNCEAFKDTDGDLDVVFIDRRSTSRLAISQDSQESGHDHKNEVTDVSANIRSEPFGRMPVGGKQVEKLVSADRTSTNYRSRGKRDKTESESESLPAKKRRMTPSKVTAVKKPNVQQENYVRINLKKKVFCRGKKKFNYRRYKFSKWKQMNKWKETPFLNCKSPDGADEEKEDEDYSSIPDEILLQAKVEMEQRKSTMLSNNLEQTSCQTKVSTSAESVDNSVRAISVSGPICDLVKGNLPKDVDDDVMAALKLFGYSQFQFGQLDTIKRVLSGLTTLLIQPTGSGKSLCYLLPAYLYARLLGAVTLVISPLVSLMDDQLMGVPKFLRAACHHTGMTAKQREKVRDAFSAGKVDVLFLSPEALVSGAGSSFGVLPVNTPPIAFVCIDEIHCVSAWSHNFRPSYLRLCRVVRNVLGVRCILGLTATASTATAENVLEHLGVSRDDLLSVIKFNVLPHNLELTVSKGNTEETFLQLLKSKPFMYAASIIVYCIRREQTERLASIIRTCLQTEADEWTAEAYHAGLSPSMRHSVQKRFMSGKLRVVVATIAFGMGLNKLDVRAVIHFNMPKSIESYVQEIGRAGRDGYVAHCHCFLDLHCRDQQELRRHIYANTVDRAAIQKLVKKVFRPCRCNSLKEIEGTLLEGSASRNVLASSQESWNCKGHEVAFIVDDAVEELDIKEEGIDTLLCYLESHPEHLIKLLNRTYANCVIFSYGGVEQLANLAKKNSTVAVAMAMAKNKPRRDSEAKNASNQIEFNLTELAQMLGQKSVDLKRDLKKLQWNTIETEGVVKYRKTDFVVNFVGVSFHMMAVGDLPPEKLDQLTDYLHNRVLFKENTDIEMLEKFHSILNNLSSAHYSLEEKLNHVRSQKLKAEVREHFEKSSVPFVNEVMALKCENIFSKDVAKEDDVRASIRRFLGIHNDIRFSGRAVARIFHGIGSPRYPAEVWGKTRQFWRCHLDVDFNALCMMATEEILRTLDVNVEASSWCDPVAPNQTIDVWNSVVT